MLLASGDHCQTLKMDRLRFSSHVEKIASQNGHSYAFEAKLDTVGNSDVRSLVAANQAVPKSYEKKNLSTYVDARDGKRFRPSEAIAQEDAVRLAALACECCALIDVRRASPIRLFTKPSTRPLLRMVPTGTSVSVADDVFLNDGYCSVRSRCRFRPSLSQLGAIDPIPPLNPTTTQRQIVVQFPTVVTGGCLWCRCLELARVRSVICRHRWRGYKSAREPLPYLRQTELQLGETLRARKTIRQRNRLHKHVEYERPSAR